MSNMAMTEWVLLAYRVPREPSTPRIAIWRKLKRLGVAQLGDGLVGLPADARTREQLEWIADDVVAAGGTTSVWLARPTSAVAEREFAQQMATARAAEYRSVTERARAAFRDGSVSPAEPAERAAQARRLRAELQRIARRDFFPPPERDEANVAVRALATVADTSPATLRQR